MRTANSTRPGAGGPVRARWVTPSLRCSCTSPSQGRGRPAADPEPEEDYPPLHGGNRARPAAATTLSSGTQGDTVEFRRARPSRTWAGTVPKNRAARTAAPCRSRSQCVAKLWCSRRRIGVRTHACATTIVGDGIRRQEPLRSRNHGQGTDLRLAQCQRAGVARPLARMDAGQPGRVEVVRSCVSACGAQELNAFDYFEGGGEVQ